MTPAEAAVALSLCAAYDRRTIGEADARAWAEALPDIRLEDARAAIVRHYRERRDWIMPADVLGLVRIVRRDRIIEAECRGALRVEPPRDLDADLDITWRREYRAALGDGEDITSADARACSAVGATREPEAELTQRPVAQLVDAAARSRRRRA